MPIRALALALALVTVPALHGQQFGEPFPLTNTRYEAAASHNERLVSNGREFFLFWQALDERSHVTRLSDGPRGIGFPLSVKPSDVVWNGTAFIVAYGDRTRAFDEEGRPLSEPSPGMAVYSPYLAAGGDSMLLLATSVDAAVSMSLDKDGRPLDGAFTRLVTGKALAVAGNGKGFAGLIASRKLTLVMFDRDGAVVSRRELAEAGYDTVAAVASGPGGYLVVHCTASRCAAESLDAAGETIGSVTLDTDTVWLRPAVVWDGTGWTVAYNGERTVRIARLDADGQTILSREEAPGQSAPLLAAIGSRVVIAWAPVYGQPLVTSDLPLADHVRRLATSLVRSQTLMATVTAHDATLVVWRDDLYITGGDVRAGLRRRNGDWIELAIPPGYDRAAAGTDGRNFVITLGQFFNRSDASLAISFTPHGWRRWSVPLPFFAEGIAWNGSMFALIGSMLAGPTLVAALSRGGDLSEPQLVGEYVASTAIASDGNGFLAVVGGNCIFPGCSTHAIGIRLDSTLQPVDAEPLVFEDDLFATSPSVVWDGRDYVVRWDVFEDFARVPPVGPFRRVRGPSDFYTYMPLVRTPGGYATVRDNSRAPAAVVERYARGGILQAAFYLPPAVEPYFSRLAILPDGRIAVVYPARQHDAPHYGALRLMMSISDLLPPLKPDPPVLTATTTADGQLLIAWTPPARPVNGYRLEYRPPRSPWRELDRWIPDAAPRWTALEASYEWRMRAWSDGGVSDYSNVVRSSSATARSRID